MRGLTALSDPPHSSRLRRATFSRKAGEGIACALFVGLLLAASPARADDDADRHAIAAQVLDELHAGDMVAGIVPTIIAQIRTNLTHDDPDLVKAFTAYQPHLQAEADATRPALQARLVDVYAKTFTLDELKDMLAYYRSPVGQRIIANQPAINRDMLAAARDWGTGLAATLSRDAAAELQNPKN